MYLFLNLIVAAGMTFSFSFFLPFHSEPTQCVTLFSRQGTNDTIDEVEAEQDQAEEEAQEVGHDRQQAQEQEQQQEQELSVEQPEGESEGGGGDMEVDMEREEAQGLEAQWMGAEAGETTQPSATEEEEEEREAREHTARHDEGESSGLEYLHADGREGQLFTPDTDAPNTSDADVPPSYSKAVSFDRLSVSTDGSSGGKRMMLMTPDSRSDLDDSLLPSMTTELTASELLLNK